MKETKKHPKFRKNILKLLLKKAYFTFFPVRYYKILGKRFEKENPFSDESVYSEYEGKSKYRLGILKEFSHYHQFFIAACREMNISYKLIDIMSSDWIDNIMKSGCDAFLVWPSPVTTFYKEMYDERLRIMVNDLGKSIFPTYNELWMWESKRRMRDWLVAHQYPTPKTWIFYNYAQAVDFINHAHFPLVFKMNYGDCSKGVEIIKNKRKARRFMKKAFGRGILLDSSYYSNFEWGSILFQEYLPDAIEWRVIKIAESYFGYMKKKIGGYASGSHAGVYGDVPRVLLDLIREMSERHDFMSLSIDVMLNPDYSPYVIEVQSIFGDTEDPRKLRVQGKPGRYLYNRESDKYIFEEGIFDQNICCNLRIEHVLKCLAEGCETR